MTKVFCGEYTINSFEKRASSEYNSQHHGTPTAQEIDEKVNQIKR